MGVAMPSGVVEEARPCSRLGGTGIFLLGIQPQVVVNGGDSEVYALFEQCVAYLLGFEPPVSEFLDFLHHPEPVEWSASWRANHSSDHTIICTSLQRNLIWYQKLRLQ